MISPTARLALIPLLLAPTLPADAAQDDVRILDARARRATLNLIRQAKFDLTLPGAMPATGVATWIHRIPLATPLPAGAPRAPRVVACRGTRAWRRGGAGGAGRAWTVGRWSPAARAAVSVASTAGGSAEAGGRALSATSDTIHSVRPSLR